MQVGKEFVAGWFFKQVLGEGSYGKVYLCVEKDTSKAVAIKILESNGNQDVELAIKKEASIHRILQHNHIIQFLSYRTVKTSHYIVLQFADGGELFDRIEPDRGIDEKLARRYFRQLMSAISYLHNHGVTHRDLKPENVLLTNDNSIKLSDFGLATLFKRDGAERRLDRVCGTKPYVAPEVFNCASKGYRAEPADVWSLGIILAAMLTGQLPWEAAVQESKSYVAWRDRKVFVFSKLGSISAAFVKGLLDPVAELRMTMTKMRNHPWMSARIGANTQTVLATEYEGDIHPPEVCSLPTLYRATKNWADDSQFLTQTMQPDHGLFVTRLTRLTLTCAFGKAMNCVTDCLNTMGIQSTSSKSELSCKTSLEKHGSIVTFKVSFISRGDVTLIDVRRSRGDGLQLKRIFRELKDSVSRRHPEILAKEPLTISRNFEQISGMW